jgi:hypothetical protein
MNILNYFKGKFARILFALFILGLSVFTPAESVATQDYVLCEGRGERCRVWVDGIPVSFAKGKDNSAIVIQL